MMHRVRSFAENASVKAQPTLLQRLDSLECRRELSTMCGEISDRNPRTLRRDWTNQSAVPAATLLQMLRDSANSAEIGHAFDSTDRGGDPYLDTVMNNSDISKFYPNLWQAKFLNFSHPRSLDHPNITEVFLYGAKPCNNPSRCTWNESTNRIVYGTLGSSHRALVVAADPAVQWGTVSLLLNQSFIKDIVGIAPTDTGTWAGKCKGLTFPFQRSPPAGCDAFWWPPGTEFWLDTGS